MPNDEALMQNLDTHSNARVWTDDNGQNDNYPLGGMGAQTSSSSDLVVTDYHKTGAIWTGGKRSAFVFGQIGTATPSTIDENKAFPVRCVKTAAY